jgi:hypothetical protein
MALAFESNWVTFSPFSKGLLITQIPNFRAHYIYVITASKCVKEIEVISVWTFVEACEWKHMIGQLTLLINFICWSFDAKFE